MTASARAALAGLAAFGFSALVTAQAGTSGQTGQSPQVPAFRSRVAVVPVDVDVLDSRGRPITDLRQDEFQVFEDGRPQAISHFSRHAMSALDVEPSNAGPAFRSASADTLAPQEQRIFVILLGRGRLQYPARGIDAVTTFLTEQVLPQDQVAIMAWNRTTGFTTDHARLVGVLDRFRKGHEHIETWFQEQERTLAAMFGPIVPTPPIQERIDGIFGPAARTVLPDPLSTEVPSLTAAISLAASELMRNDLMSLSAAPTTVDAFVNRTLPANAGLSFEAFIEQGSRTLGDLARLYSAVTYLRYLEGEKHLVFLTERGFFLPGGPTGLGALAADARVAISLIQTGGLTGSSTTMNSILGAPAGMTGGGPLRSVADEARNQGYRTAQMPMFMAQGLRDIATATGGVASVFRPAAEGIGRVDRLTRGGYLLGYQPSNQDWDGRFRKIEVKVSRPGARVVARSGYYGRDQLVPIDRRQFLSYTRIAAAGGLTEDVRDISLEVARVEPDRARNVVSITVSLERDDVLFREEGGRQVASLEVAAFCGNDSERLLGEQWSTVDLRLTPEAYARLQQEPLTFRVEVPVTSIPRFIKVVAYDYAADKIGSTTATLR